MTKEEHLAWCKQRALEYVTVGNIGGGAGFDVFRFA